MKSEGSIPLGHERAYTTAAGAPVYLSPNPALHSFCLSLYVRGGSMQEPKASLGITHFLEHLLFRHLDNLHGGTLSRELDSLGLSFEAVTYREFLWVSLCGAPRHLPRAIEIFSRLLAPLSVTKKDVDTERARIKAEIREEGEKGSLEYFSDGILFRGTPLVESILGTAGTLNTLTAPRLAAYKSAFFTKENLFFVLTGKADESAISLLSDATAPYPLPSGAPRANLAPRAEGVFARNALVAVQNSRKTAVRLTVDVDPTQCSDAALTLLYDILFGDGEECRLYRALSERTGYIYSFSASLEQYSNLAFIHILYEIPKNKLEESLGLLISVLREAKHMTGDALPGARAPYTENAAFILDGAKELNWSLAYERHILSLPYASPEARSDAFRAVTPEDLSALAEALFRPDCLSLCLKADKRTVDTARLREILLSV